MARTRSSTISIWRGDTLILSIDNLGDISGRDNIFFTVKRYTHEADSGARVQISESGGLLCVNGAAAATAANGRITVLDATRGRITVLLASEEVAKLENDYLGYYDVQVQSGVLTETLRYGNAKVIGDATLDTTGSGLTPEPWYLGPWLDYDASIPAISAADVVIIYQPKFDAGLYARTDAQTYANSLLNIVNPGTYDAFGGVAPAFDPAIGWQATGTQYLETGYVAGGTDQDHSMFIAFTGGTNPCEVVGALDAGGPVTVLSNINGSNKTFANCQAVGWTNHAGVLTEGVMGMAGVRAYADGTQVLTLTASALNMTEPQYVMCLNNSGAPFGFPTVNVQALVYISTTITEAQSQALSWAMGVIKDA